MPRYIEVALTSRDTHCVARLLDEEAGPYGRGRLAGLAGDAYHAKYARNEVYTFVPAFADPDAKNPDPPHNAD